MPFRDVISQLNFFGRCQKYGISLWQCPDFLFLVMGFVIVVSAVLSYVLGNRYVDDPLLTVLAVLMLSVFLLIIAFAITQSFERLAEANRMKTEFIGVVSHQLRSPLTNLRWGLDFLIGEETKRSQEELGYFQMLKENTSRMNELVNDLLTVSRIDEGRFPFRKQEFGFEDVVQAVITEFQSFIQAANVDVNVEGERIPKMYNDPGLVRHVVNNLVDNAIRYASEEQAAVPSEDQRKNTITIRYEERNNHLYVEVEDNGVGIPKDDQKYIFQKFFRSKNAVRHQTQGSGLGLYIVKSLLEKAGGDIGFRSEENKGSTFWFTLPMDSAPETKKG